MNACRSDDSSRFLAGVMTAAETCAFENHLEVCTACRDQLQQRAGDEDSWRMARELLTFQSHSAASGDHAATAGIAHLEADVEWLPQCTELAVRSFLAPSDDPAMVGRVGSYDIAGILGRGSAGIVLKGFDRALSRNVAIKVLDPVMAGVGAARQRFAREARAMAAVSHEHVVAVYEVSEHAGLPFFVMEYVAGGSLERRLRVEGPLDVVSVVRIGLQTSLALAAAHAQGLVHRDIKPGNILLDRGTERVRVADFGLVRVANDVTCTRSGFVAGTPQYMAPEQVCAETCDGQADLFSLGAVMYALCTGHPPFRADTVYSVLQRVVHDNPRPICQQNPLVPRWLEAFILKLLSKKRTERFASAEETAQILQDELVHLQNPAQVAEPSRDWLRASSKTSLPPRRRMALATGVIIGIAALILGLSTWLGRGQNGNAQTSAQGRQATVAAAASRDVAPSVTTPLWSADGTTEVLREANALEAATRAPAAPASSDGWLGEVREVHRRLTELSNEDP